METLKKSNPPTTEEVQLFLNEINFTLPDGFLEFFRQANSAEFYNESGYIILWPLTEMIKLNKDYNVNEYVPEFFIFGSDGGDIAYCIEKKSGYIYDMPFIGMSHEEAVFKSKSLTEFLEIV